MKSIIRFVFLLTVFCCFYLLSKAQTSVNDTSTTKLQSLYQYVDNEARVAKKMKYRPLIGISTYHSIHRDSGVHNTYVNAVMKAGGIPVLIPLTSNASILYALLSRIDGIIMTGGEDLDTSYYGEKPIPQMGEVDSLRDVYDLTLIRLAAKRRMPMLGICRGEQLINAAFGGTLYQDLPTQKPSDICHNQKVSSAIPTHDATIQPGTQLSQILHDSIFKVNSFHHQAVKQVAPGFKVNAYSPDGVVEGIESSLRQNIIAIQFHPEGLILSGDMTMLQIFRNLIDRAAKYHKRK